jgi:Conserved hypothetical ATP binding protein
MGSTVHANTALCPGITAAINTTLSSSIAAPHVHYALLMPQSARTFTCLCSHIPVMKRLLEHFKYWGYTVCGVYALDATFMGDPAKFISGTLLSLSAMVSHLSNAL